MFFDSNEKLKIPLSLVPKCGICGYSQNTKHPKTKPKGKGNKILFITKGLNDDGKFLNDEEHTKLERILDNHGVSLSRDCQITGNLICPNKKRIDDRLAWDHCRPNIIKTIKDEEFTSVVLLGAETFSLFSYLWKKDNSIASNKWIGWSIPSQFINSWVFPTYSVADTIGDRKAIENIIFQASITRAVKKKERPFRKVPDYKSQVQITNNPKMVRNFVKDAIKKKKEIAFDLETTMLKPDHDSARIVSCSISDGKETWAFEWNDENESYMKEILVNPDCGKIASNLKFEHRWIKRKLGVDVVNWTHDTMLAAHILDNRGGISSIKFQSFVLLGQPDYDSDMKEFLKSREGGGYGLNTINKAPMRQLLLYNGLDSLLEYKVAMIQKKQLGI